MQYNAASRVHFLKQLKRAGAPITAALLYCYSEAGPRLCLSGLHSGLTAGQCNAIENIQEHPVAYDQFSANHRPHFIKTQA